MVSYFEHNHRRTARRTPTNGTPCAWEVVEMDTPTIEVRELTEDEWKRELERRSPSLKTW